MEGIFIRGEYCPIYDREKIEQEIIPNSYGMIEPVHFLKEIKGYRVYGGITCANECVYYASVA